MTAGQAVRDAAVRLAATSDTARLDAELLMAHALGCTRSQLLLRGAGEPAPAAFATLVERRLMHEPVAYIIGTQEFWGLDLIVTPDVLIPRADTETLVEAAQAALADRPPARVLDLGTGSGALLFAALTLWPRAQGVGLERSPGARNVAQRNADALGLSTRAQILPGDWTQGHWAEHLGTFDLILANPPYVEAAAPLALSVKAFEPASALFAGDDGLDDYRILIPCLPRLLTPGGLAMVEIGWTQADAVSGLAQGAGMTVRLHHDLGNRPRALEMTVDNGRF